MIILIGCNNVNNNKGGIPFDYNGYIILSTKINDSVTAQLMFDSGSNIMILDSSIASKSGLSKLKTKNTSLAYAGYQGSIGMALINESIRYQVGNYKFYAKPTGILNFHDTTGYGIGGVVGIDLLKNCVIKFDFISKRIYTDSINHLELKNSLPISIENNQILIQIETELENGRQIKGYFLLDFGSKNALSFTNEFAQKNNFFKNINKKIKHTTLNNSACGKSSGYLFRVNYVKIENVKFNKPILDYSLDTSGALSHSKPYIGIVGLELLSRTDITIDFEQKLIQFEPNNKISNKFKASKKGFGYSRLDNKEMLLLTSIHENLVIEKSGLRLGDTIVQINDKKISSFTNDKLNKLFNSDERIHFKILKNGKKNDLYLTPAEEL